MALTPNEKARLREIEAQLEADDTKLARLLRTEPAGGPLLMRLQQLRTWQLNVLFGGGLLAGPVGLEAGLWWLGLFGFVVATAAFMPLIGRISLWRKARLEMLSDH
jgi:hypothetical protein